LPVKVWIQAARLRTLPLAIAGTVSGNLLANTETGDADLTISVLSILTAIFLQVLSNYANDYGDFKNGADTSERTDRMMASGAIPEKQMKIAIGILIGLCLASGISLLVVAIDIINSSFWIMLGMGIAGMFAAYYYTAGKNPYGYIGLGDLSVFIFFGLLSVAGTYFLQTQMMDSPVWWIASALGLMSVGVLNVNNIRDIDSDKLKNKITIPVLIGYKNAFLYQYILLTLAFICFLAYSVKQNNDPIFIAAFSIIFAAVEIMHLKALKKASTRMAFNKQLKFLSLLTFILSFLFSLYQAWD
jgi:1,4-dihydroxy-2-naphthoate polyprenyltransferase